MYTSVLQQALDAFNLYLEWDGITPDLPEKFEAAACAARISLAAAINQSTEIAAPVAPAVPEGDKLDAERLDWIDSASSGTVRRDLFNGCIPHYVHWGTNGKTLRQSIDAAMQATGATP